MRNICTNGNCTYNNNGGDCEKNNIKSKTINRCKDFKEMGCFGIYFGKHGDTSGYEP